MRQSGIIETDLAISGGKIAALGQGLAGRSTLETSGKLVIPGGVDPHVHLEMPTPVSLVSR